MPRRRERRGGAGRGQGRKPIGAVARKVARTVKLMPDEAAAQDAAAHGPWATWAHGVLVAAAPPPKSDE